MSPLATAWLVLNLILDGALLAYVVRFFTKGTT